MLLLCTHTLYIILVETLPRNFKINIELPLFSKKLTYQNQVSIVFGSIRLSREKTLHKKPSINTQVLQES